MKTPSRRRAYDGTSRQEAARRTRQAILTAARESFLARGYAATTMPGIARAAGTALDTVYATVGKKPELFRHLVESAISGMDVAVPPEEREYVKAIRAEPSAAGKLRAYAAALAHIQPRLAPLFVVLRAAASQDAELEALWRDISGRRASNMRLLAQELAATGELRPDISVDRAADVVWSMNAPEYYILLVTERGWTASEFADWLARAWTRLLL